MCEPGLSLDEYFADAQPWERPIFDVVSTHIESLGAVIVDPISIGILFKNGPMFCQLRAMKKWSALGLVLPHKLTSPRLSRKVSEQSGKFWHVVNLDDVKLVDDEILGWITESYHVAGGTSPNRDDAGSMVPDDVDEDMCL